ncbi:MAG: radical SAM protein [Endomicrobiaceae bacterium]|nr:radical SAM protein [Endomicrobiaceae bacterium]
MNYNIDKLYKLMEKCRLCPRNCGVNRLKGETGACRTGREVKVASINLHYGEEPPISAESGSGTIFFTNCNLSCVFCQNYPISQLSNGNAVTAENLADKMLELQQKGANNINLVTPTHVYPFVAETVFIAKQKGLTIPVLSNCGGYESVEVLELMEDFIDIYMPDMKYSSNFYAKKFSKIDNYVENNRRAVKEMFRQKGHLKINGGEIAEKGLLIRHLVLPNNVSGSKEIFDFIAGEISEDTYVSVMAQYHTANISDKFEEINRKLTQKEYDDIVEYFENVGLHNGWVQEL